MWKPSKGQQFFIVKLVPYVVILGFFGGLASCTSTTARGEENCSKRQDAALSSFEQKPMEYPAQELFQKVEFIEHVNLQQPMQNYLSMNIAFGPVERLRQQVEARLGSKLKSRGEAHITLISPIDYGKSNMMQKIGMKEIHQKALQLEIQDKNFVPVCIGRGKRTDSKSGQTLETYFIVVDSPELFELRKRIKEELQLDDFSLENFYPHITLGFTERDLHLEDGVVKDLRACWIMLSAQQ